MELGAPPQILSSPLHAVVNALVVRAHEQQTELRAAALRDGELRKQINQMAVQLKRLAQGATDGSIKTATLAARVKAAEGGVEAAQAGVEAVQRTVNLAESDRTKTKTDVRSLFLAQAELVQRASAAEERIAASEAGLDAARVELGRRTLESNHDITARGVRSLESALATLTTRGTARHAAHGAAVDARFVALDEARNARRVAVGAKVAELDDRICALDSSKASSVALREEAAALQAAHAESSVRDAAAARALIAEETSASRMAHAEGTAANAELLATLKKLIRKNAVVHGAKARANAVQVKAMEGQIAAFRARIEELDSFVGSKLGQPDLVVMRKEFKLLTGVVREETRADARRDAAKLGVVVEKCESAIFAHGVKLEREAEARVSDGDELRSGMEVVDVRIDLMWKQISAMAGGEDAEAGGAGGAREHLGHHRSHAQLGALESGLRALRESKAEKKSAERMGLRIDSLFSGMHQIESYIIESQRALAGAPNRAPLVSYARFGAGANDAALTRAALAAVETGSVARGTVVRTRPISQSARENSQVTTWRATGVVDEFVSSRRVVDTEPTSARARNQEKIAAAKKQELAAAAWAQAAMAAAADNAPVRPESEDVAAERVQSSLGARTVSPTRSKDAAPAYFDVPGTSGHSTPAGLSVRPPLSKPSSGFGTPASWSPPREKPTAAKAAKAANGRDAESVTAVERARTAQVEIEAPMAVTVSGAFDERAS